MISLVEDFEAFCSESKLLPTDQVTMFVPPCGRSIADNIQFKLYYCPASWSRRKAKYIGLYSDKRVKAIGVIKKIASCNVNLEKKLVETLNVDGAPLTKEEEERILGAAQSALESNGWNLSTDTKFFLCDEIQETDFKKTSSGGIMGHRYFNLKELFQSMPPQTLEELAHELRKKEWQ
jgi:hypothetical protein